MPKLVQLSNLPLLLGSFVTFRDAGHRVRRQIQPVLEGGELAEATGRDTPWNVVQHGLELRRMAVDFEKAIFAA